MKKTGWIPVMGTASGGFLFIAPLCGNVPVVIRPCDTVTAMAYSEIMKTVTLAERSRCDEILGNYFKRRTEMMGDCISIRRIMFQEAVP